jgi:hypothetical protein
MPTLRLFSHEPDVIWVPHLHAVVHTRLQLGVDGDIVQDTVANVIESGNVADVDQEIAAFCAAYVDVSASIMPVALDSRGRWQHVEE